MIRKAINYYLTMPPQRAPFTESVYNSILQETELTTFHLNEAGRQNRPRPQETQPTEFTLA